ncbi:hypothetical protein GLW08_03085 [Pontibacillus yanchengensis]|uniref:Uncharacterized protein n=2 Tax=Pontibacillus yanchengensis TaxID=462910 RepID=A0A6I4ZX91_9BACI|nr:hypothetical protein [Pontibacillus yanchengensis]MYL34698.1 hypothetical protein [Pontibacillus yanchengensis]MYL52317.1 hypothetical protein [Pontibacillus yanchengensis]
MKKHKYISLLIVGVFLVLLSTPYIVVVTFDFYPNGYTYKSLEGEFYIQQLNPISHVEEEISINEDTGSRLIVGRYEARSNILDIQAWYRKSAASLGVLLGSLFFLFIPRTYHKNAFRELKVELENDIPSLVKKITTLPKEMKSDFPRLSYWLFEREFPNLIGVVSLIISLFMIFNSFFHYPALEVREVDTIVKRLLSAS